MDAVLGGRRMRAEEFEEEMEVASRESDSIHEGKRVCEGDDDNDDIKDRAGGC